MRQENIIENLGHATKWYEEKVQYLKEIRHRIKQQEGMGAKYHYQT
jgi:hypothetical protein